MNLRVPVSLFFCVSALLAAGCTTRSTSGGTSAASPPDKPAARASAPSGRATYTAAPPVGDVAAYEKVQVIIETERGNVILDLYPKEAPQTVASFVKLAQDGYFDGLTFHRVVPGFVVQGGDPQGNGQGGPGYTLPAEFSAKKHLRGTVAMARTADPNSAGSQFYICLAPQPSLDNQYTVFGQVTKGMENVDNIKQGDHMLKVRIEPKSGGAEASPASAPSASASGAASPASAPSASASGAASRP